MSVYTGSELRFVSSHINVCVFRVGLHFSVGCVCSWSGEMLSSLYPVSTPSARHAGSSTALYLSKMALEWVSAHVHHFNTCESASLIKVSLYLIKILIRYLISDMDFVCP